MGMVGGSLEGFIGAVHRMAAVMDGQIELVCGAFSSTASRSVQTGEHLGLPADRIYSSYQEMIEKEAAIPQDQRMEFVSIVTPNHLHFEPAKLSLESGFHVLCEKPVTISYDQAKQLQVLAESTGLYFGLTHTYTGYPMVKEARQIIKSGRIGMVRKVVVEYPQGWLSSPVEKDGQKQASWRTDPAQAGISCCVGDIGTHAENLAEYITGLAITELSADISTFVEGRELEDDANILVRFNNGAKGVIIVSQIACGEENELKIRVYGEKGGIEWLQSDPNTLIFKSSEGPQKVIRTGAGYSWLSEQARAHIRLPGGHPEGYIEAHANLYRNFAYAIRDAGKIQAEIYDFPTVADGVRGMRFIDAVIESGKKNSRWITL